MTKIKNTKKGMAKKTLSMSLVVAMLATKKKFPEAMNSQMLYPG